MATKSTANGRDRLDEAMALLIQNQAAFVGQKAETDHEWAKYRQDSSDRFARLERDMAEVLRGLAEQGRTLKSLVAKVQVLDEHGRLLAEHSRLLAEHSRTLERLPEAIREKIGFKPA